MANSRLAGALTVIVTLGLLTGCGASGDDPSLERSAALGPSASGAPHAPSTTAGSVSPAADESPDAAPHRHSASRRFRHRDQDGDGALSEQELGARWARLSIADTNQDEVLTREELTRAKSEGKLGRGPHAGRRRSPEHLLRRWDEDRDGQLTAAELPPRAWQRFSAADTDANGSLDVKELTHYLEQAAPRRRFRGRD